MEQKITTVSEVLTEAAMYDRVNIEAVISHLSNITQHERDGKMITVAHELFTMKQASQTCQY